jgi:hypothetical protein
MEAGDFSPSGYAGCGNEHRAAANWRNHLLGSVYLAQEGQDSFIISKDRRTLCATRYQNANIVAGFYFVDSFVDV